MKPRSAPQAWRVAEAIPDPCHIRSSCTCGPLHKTLCRANDRGVLCETELPSQTKAQDCLSEYKWTIYCLQFRYDGLCSIKSIVCKFRFKTCIQYHTVYDVGLNVTISPPQKHYLCPRFMNSLNKRKTNKTV